MSFLVRAFPALPIDGHAMNVMSLLVVVWFPSSRQCLGCCQDQASTSAICEAPLPTLLPAMPKFPAAQRASIRSRWAAMTMRFLYLMFRHLEVVRGLALLTRYPRIRDILTSYLPSEDRMMTLHTMASAEVAKMDAKYPNDPDTCLHAPTAIKSYGGSYGRVRLCQSCGARWKQDPTTKTWESIQPKADPGTSTPLLSKEQREKKKADKKDRAEKQKPAMQAADQPAAPSSASSVGQQPWPGAWNPFAVPPPLRPGASMPFSAPVPTAATNPFLPFPPMTPEVQQQQWNYYLQQQQHANVVASSMPTNIVNGQVVPPIAKPRAPVPPNLTMPPRPSPVPTAAPLRPEVYAMSEDGLSTVESVVIPPTGPTVIAETVLSSSSSDLPPVVDEAEI